MGDYSSYTDEQLVLLLKNSDAGAFSEIYHRYWKLLFYVAGSKLEDAQIAKEIVQDLFTDIWERRFVIEIDKGLKPYLNVALKYKVINQQAIRQRNLRYKHTILNNTDVNLDHSTTQQLGFLELKAHLEHLVGNLPEKCQLVFRLSREEGLSHKEIAAALTISPKTVEAHLSKALHRLRHGLSHLLLILSLSAICC